MWEAKREGVYIGIYADQENDREGEADGENLILEGKKSGENYERGQMNSGLVGLADILVARLNVMIKSGLKNESPWSI